MKYKNKLSLVIILVSSYFTLLGQEKMVYDIPMSVEKGVGPYRYSVTSGTFEKKITEWKGLPDNIDSLMVFSFDLPTFFINNHIPSQSSHIYILSYIRDQVKTIICDTDNDKDFRDENKYLYPVSAKDRSISFDSLPYTKILLRSNLPVKDSFLWIKIRPFDPGYTFKMPLESVLQVFITPAQFRLGNANIAGKEYYFYSSLSPFNKVEPIINLSATIKESKFKFDPGVGYHSNDTIQIENVSYKLFWKNNLYDTLRCIRLVSEFRSTGFMVGQYLPNDKLFDINGGNKSLVDKNSFIIIDFWGTWCQPCIKEIPNLKHFYNEMDKKKFKLISLAYDIDSSKVKEFVKKYDMTWQNVFVNRSKSNNILSRYNLILFPTIIVADPAGKVLFRASDNTVKEMKLFLKSISD